MYVGTYLPKSDIQLPTAEDIKHGKKNNSHPTKIILAMYKTSKPLYIPYIAKFQQKFLQLNKTCCSIFFVL